MPRRRKENQPVELEAAATFEGWDEMDEAFKRRIRNRLSQRHFRERKSLYISSLEKASKASTQSESARNKALAKEIADLRAASLKMRAKVLKLACSLHSLGAEIGKILDVNGQEESESPAPEDDDRLSPLSHLAYDGASPGDFSCRNISGELTDFAELQPNSEHEATANNDNPEMNNSREPADLQPEPGTEQGHPSEHFDSGAGGISDPGVHSVPLGWDGQNATATYPEPLGSRAFSTTFFSPRPATKMASSYGDVPEFNYTDCTSQRSHRDVLTQSHWLVDQGALQQSEHHNATSLLHNLPSQTNLTLPTGHLQPNFGALPQQNNSTSTFARHMETLELQVRCRFDAAPDKCSRETLIRSCRTIMSLFVQNAWPSSSSVWFKSQVPQIIGPILLWRIQPSYETYNLLGADYKPTELQLSVRHSAIIDWIPYSELRDRVIMHYNYSVVLDRLLCDMMNSYVIEVPDLSQILPQAPRGRAYFGIWNIFHAIDLAFENQNNGRRSGSQLGSADFGDSSADEAAKDVENPFGIYNEFALSDHSGSPTCAREKEDLDEFSNPGTARNGKPFNLVDILTTPTSVLKLSHDIRLYASRSWRFDRTLFDKYPELKFNGYENMVAKGRSCRIPTAPPDGPSEITEETMREYQKAVAGIA